MTAKMTAHFLAGLVLGVLGAWLLGVATNTLFVPLAALLLVAVVIWREGFQALATSLALGAASVTLFFAWLFAALGDGLATM